MKNKRIKILADGEWVLPVGTKVKTHSKGKIIKSRKSWICDYEESYVITETTPHFYEVDFSEVKPLYPHKDLVVPEGGIFTKTHSSLLEDIGQVGFTLFSYREHSHILHKWDWFEKEKNKNIQAFIDLFELQRTLPKRIDVCSECWKEVCECKHESGWYRVKICGGWTIRYYHKESDHFCHSETINPLIFWLNDGDRIVDWNNPINVVPDKEV